ncbi:MAG: hypothetical protein KFF73_13980 [Cyclobacteriaceae bacterium]|nr:hypothetical protein [Cyclobacteriaceae bacterium]
MKEDRQLVAIMFTDIVGYTAIMQRNEQEAMAIRSRHREVFSRFTGIESAGEYGERDHR